MDTLKICIDEDTDTQTHGDRASQQHRDTVTQRQKEIEIQVHPYTKTPIHSYIDIQKQRGTQRNIGTGTPIYRDIEKQSSRDG